jgi:hypothetical protein
VDAAAGTGMLEEAKVQRLLVWLYAPGYCVSCFDVDPADEVRLLRLASSAWRGSMHLPCCALPAAPCPPWSKGVNGLPR